MSTAALLDDNEIIKLQQAAVSTRKQRFVATGEFAKIANRPSPIPARLPKFQFSKSDFRKGGCQKRENMLQCVREDEQNA